MIFNDQTFAALPDSVRFGLSALILYGICYGVSTFNRGAGLGLAAIVTGMFLFEGGAIAHLPKG